MPTIFPVVVFLILIGIVVNVGWYALLIVFFCFLTLCLGYAVGLDEGKKEQPQQRKQPETVAELLAEANRLTRLAEQVMRQRDAQRRAEQQRRQAPPRPKPKAKAAPPHWKLLGLKPGATLEQISERYRELALKAHPDRPGGSVRAMQALNIARDLARRETAAKVKA